MDEPPPNNDTAEQLRLAIGLHQRGQLNEAQAIYAALLRREPSHADALHLLGLIAYQQRQFGDAVALIDRAIAAAPGNAAFYANRGLALHELTRFAAAIADFDKAIALNPAFAAAYSNRGNARQELKQLDAAIADFDKAIALKPDYAEAYYNRGNAVRELGKLPAALANYDQAIAVRSDYAAAHWNKALILLLRGDFASGFELYEWRWRYPKLNLALPAFAQPLWRGGEPLAGKTILLHSEQGLGDTIQFCRYASLAARAGAQVFLLVPKPLVALLTSLEGVSRVVAEGEPLPDFDYHCPLMSLPLAFKTVLETIPDATPYLHADPAKARAWQTRIGAPEKLKVGVVWSGGARPDQSETWPARRNIPLDLFAHALRELDIDFFSLQKGDPAESEIRGRESKYWPRGNFHNCAGDIHDFSDTAALVANLDLVVSVDTSTAHLAAALGKPTWILNRFDTEWRWLLDRNDSPWYRSVKLYRQDESRDWEPVLQRVAADLTKLASFDYADATRRLR